MLRNLTAKAIVPVAMTVTGFVLVCCILLYAAIKGDMTRSTVQHSVNLADTVVKSTHYAMLRDDRESLGNIIENIGEQQGIKHLRIFDKAGIVRFSHHPEDNGHEVDMNFSGCLGCHAEAVPKETLEAMQQARQFSAEDGANVLAITAPIYNQPVCFTGDCHAHPPEQQILGILDIGLDLTPLERNLAEMRGRMAVFTVMVLLLTLGGVAALLRRSVILPVQALADFTERALNDNLLEEFPEKEGEIAEIAANVHRLHFRLVESDKELARKRRLPHPPQAGDDAHPDSADERPQMSPHGDSDKRDSGRDTPS
jgi:sensor histidine kinase regulating citrate/malate metabolism